MRLYNRFIVAPVCLFLIVGMTAEVNGAIIGTSVNQLLSVTNNSPFTTGGASNNTFPPVNQAAFAFAVNANQTILSYVGPIAAGGANATPTLTLSLTNSVAGGGGNANSSFNYLFSLDAIQPYTLNSSATTGVSLTGPGGVVPLNSSGSLPIGAYTLSSNFSFATNSNTNNVQLQINVPEPTTLSAIGAVALMALRRRRAERAT